MTIGSPKSGLGLSLPGIGLLRSITEEKGVGGVGNGGRFSSAEWRGDSGTVVLHVVTLKRDDGCTQRSTGVERLVGSAVGRFDAFGVIVWSDKAE